MPFCTTTITQTHRQLNIPRPKSRRSSAWHVSRVVCPIVPFPHLSVGLYRWNAFGPPHVLLFQAEGSPHQEQQNMTALKAFHRHKRIKRSRTKPTGRQAGRHGAFIHSHEAKPTHSVIDRSAVEKAVSHPTTHTTRHHTHTRQTRPQRATNTTRTMGRGIAYTHTRMDGQ